MTTIDSPTIRSVREERNMTQAQLAQAVGVRSKGYISKIERRIKPVTLELALKFERWSGGKLRAAELCPDQADLLREAGEARP